MKNHKNKVITESIITFCFFLVIGIIIWQTKNHIFFLFNFIYIGIAASLGELLFGLLPRRKKNWGRKISQLLIGIYMFGVLGLLGRENMQIEGFFFYLLAGIFSGPVLHYFIAKIVGPLLFGRGWCGWACWTAMILDLLPWSNNKNGRIRYLGLIRYVHFIIALLLVMVLWFLFNMKDFDKNSIVELNWLIIGNIFYYSIAILLGKILKDNRAFCKYICPIPTFLKLSSRFSIWKIEILPEKCSSCKLCEINCPMDIKLLTYLKAGKRVTSTECIACQKCVNVCPENAVKYTKKIDWGFKEHLNYKK
mgnify:CR=1 FL=1